VAEEGARALQTDDRQMTEGRTTAHSEREHKFTFAKNGQTNVTIDTGITWFCDGSNLM